MRVDLHVHTCYSPDSLTPPEALWFWARRRGLDALAITDHNTIAGALALAQEAPLTVIVGEEIRTTAGEIIGLFLRQEIPAGLTPRETVARIHAQGGLVYIPHPRDRWRRSSALAQEALWEIIAEVDILEVWNARVTFAQDNREALALAQEYGLLRGAGSDAHQGHEIGQAYVELPPFHDAPTFLRSLAQGAVHGHTSPPLVHLGSSWAKLAKGLLPRPLKFSG
jgi:predicted metal-dependent phosphoesterase TrpH